MQGQIIDEREVMAVAKGHRLNYTRRRYGRTTYTWVRYHNGTEWVELGDPWPSINAPVREVLAAIESTEKWRMEHNATT